MTRPLAHAKIDELEQIFEEAVAEGDDAKVGAVADELTNRNPEKPRNQRLADAAKRYFEEPEPPEDEPEVREQIDYDDPAHWVSEAAEQEGQREVGSEIESAIGAGDDLPPPRPPNREQSPRAPNAVGAAPPPAPDAISREEALQVLRAWTALEVLSPASVYRVPKDIADGSEARIAKLDEKTLPWERSEKARPNTRLFYQLVLGSIRMEETTSKLLATFEDYNENGGPTPGYSPICIVTIDSKGLPVGVEAIAVSSFAWGVPIALSRNLKALSDWPKYEEGLRDIVLAPLTKADDEGDDLPVDRQMIADAYAKLIDALHLPAELIVEPQFAIRVYQFWRAEEPPEPPPMGSFFLRDLSWAQEMVAKGREPELLRKYMGIVAPGVRADVRRNDPMTDTLVAAGGAPAGAWPAVGGHPLVLLQQAAVNASARMRLLSVNGPPGTGKTTLLRDLIAAKVVERAERLAEFDDPASAFTKTSHTQTINKTVCRHHTVDAKLKGFEIVVASYNNKAVENVSEALPRTSAASFAAEMNYFRTVSDNVARGLGEDSKSTQRREDPPRVTWGLAAAVLGNSRNRYAFSQCAWRDFDFGLRSLLMELSGAPQRIEVKDKDTGRIVERRAPRIVELSPKPTKTAWSKARQAFRATRTQLKQRIVALEGGRAALATRTGAATQVAQARRAAGLAEQDWVSANLGASQIEDAHAQAVGAFETARQATADAAGAKPRMLASIFSGAQARAWRERMDAAELAQVRAEANLKQAKTRLVDKQGELERARAKQTQAATAEAAALAELSKFDTALDAARTMSGDRFGDAAFYERPPEDLQRDTAWLDPETQRLRRLLFEQAMELHRVFIEAAAGPIRNNLDLLFRTFYGKSAWAAVMKERMADLWATFFLVVPVLSTAYASIERMLGYLGEGSIGLLLLDESGQAPPQAAVGAMMRSRKVVVVGDPLQLPPVVPLPTALCDLIARDCGVDSERFVAASRAIPLVASVQTLADSACQLGTHLETMDAWIGLPLLVHRRCAEPMFSLSNRMSYEGIMVNGRGRKPSAVRDVLGPSRWMDVRPNRCIDKWSEAEGEALLRELERVAAAGLPSPDIYIISPFRIVVFQLRQLLLKQDFLRQWTSEPRRWVMERVGTVYTVQGREADTVFLVMGAAEPHQKGARNWAGNPANQLNVAITRAKENIYVIGNRFEWASAGHVAELELALP